MTREETAEHQGPPELSASYFIPAGSGSQAPDLSGRRDPHDRRLEPDALGRSARARIGGARPCPSPRADGHACSKDSSSSRSAASLVCLVPGTSGASRAGSSTAFGRSINRPSHSTYSTRSEKTTADERIGCNPSPACRKHTSAIWNLESATWNLDPANRNLDSAIRNLAPGIDSCPASSFSDRATPT